MRWDLREGLSLSFFCRSQAAIALKGYMPAAESLHHPITLNLTPQTPIFIAAP